MSFNNCTVLFTMQKSLGWGLPPTQKHTFLVSGRFSVSLLDLVCFVINKHSSWRQCK